MVIEKNIERIRADFPILKKTTYLDNAATSQKPLSVIDKINEVYREYDSNVLRGVYDISEKATEEYENSRNAVAGFLGVSSNEIIFTKNATEGMNLISDVLVRKFLEEKNEVNVLLSVAEHHANIVPWYIAKRRYKNVNIDFLDIDDSGNILMDESKIADSDIVSVTGMSNVTGLKTDPQIFKKAKDYGKVTVMDGAQSIPHVPFDRSDIDFMSFSAHKILGPFGVGIVYGRRDLLESVPDFLGGGEMISEVSLSDYGSAELPHRFEAGTPNISGVIAFSEAISYINKIGFESMSKYEKKLSHYMHDRFSELKTFKPLFPEESPILSFTHKKLHSHDVADFLNSYNVSVRSGHHCAMPLHKRLNVVSSARASLYFYNDFADIDSLISALKDIEKRFY